MSRGSGQRKRRFANDGRNRLLLDHKYASQCLDEVDNTPRFKDKDKSHFFKTANMRRTLLATFLSDNLDWYNNTYSNNPDPNNSLGAAMAGNLGLQVGEMTGYSCSNTGFPSDMQPALAYAKYSGAAGGAAAWQVFMGRSVLPDCQNGARFAIVPRPVAPGAPTINGAAASIGVGRVGIGFTAPSSSGDSPIIDYAVTCSAAGQATQTAFGAGSPIMVSGLTGGVACSCSVIARSRVGSSARSAAIVVTPLKKVGFAPITMLLLD